VDFNSYTDSVVGVAAGLVNLLTPGEAYGRAYSPPGGTARAAEASALLRGGGGRLAVTDDEAASLALVAARLRAVFEADSADTAAELVNALLRDTGAHPVLQRHDGEPWHLHFHAADDTLVNGWAAGCATGLAVVLGSELIDRLGVCTASRCDRVYVDTSRNGTRRYCSTTCQNRTKTAAFRARVS
jgi:predicted RNA-binding Zn ribbon-like protein